MSKVLVIGDGCTDIFQYGKCERLSPEAPVPVFVPTINKKTKGMAINVHNNLVALDINSKILSVDTPTKTRYVDEVSNQIILRVDENDEIEPLHNLETLKKTKWDGVIISDYNKGLLDEEQINIIIRYCKKNNIPTFLDTKKKIGSWANDIDFIKINEKEYLDNEGNFNEFKNQLITTLGNRGAKHYNKKIGTMNSYPIENKQEVRDLSGAGDTFLAGFVANYLKTSDIADSINFANKCASYVVTQKGVVVVDKDKI